MKDKMKINICDLELDRDISNLMLLDQGYDLDMIPDHFGESDDDGNEED